MVSVETLGDDEADEKDIDGIDEKHEEGVS